MFVVEDFGRFQSGVAKLREGIAFGRRLAPTLKPILIVGEVGSGRREMALEIISKSSRSDRPVVRWSAHSDFSQINSQGTILVENLENFSKAQLELLLKRIGNSLGDRAMESPRWIITACRDIFSWVRRGEIPQGLFQILSEQLIVMPSLAERKEDLPSIVESFVSNLNEICGSNKKLSGSSINRLQALKYDRNWTELFEKIERAYACSSGPLIELHDLGFQELQVSTNLSHAGLSLYEMERRLIVQTLEMTMQNRTKAADILGISIRTLRNKLSEYREMEG
jgi:two-component system response regulator FlrC